MPDRHGREPDRLLSDRLELSARTGASPISTGSTGTAVVSSGRRRCPPSTSPSTTSGRRSRAWPDPAGEGDQFAIDRPALPYVPVPIRGTNRSDAARDGTDGDFYLAGAAPQRPGGGLEARLKPERLVSCRQRHWRRCSRAGVCVQPEADWDRRRLSTSTSRSSNRRPEHVESRTTSSSCPGRWTTPTCLLLRTAPRREVPKTRQRQLLVLQ